MIVIDASLAVKWYVRETLTFEALDLLAGREGAIVVPDIFITEVTGALVRRANVDKTMRPESEAAIGRFMSLFETGAIIAIRSEPKTIAVAAGLAMDLGHPVKDCIYLALAMEQDCPLVTADARFAAKAQEAQVSVSIQMLGK